jgi:hypothetical protein
MAATLTTASIEPKRSTAASNQSTQVSASQMSRRWARVWEPSGSSAAATSSSRSALRAPSTTLAPSRNAAATISLPRPGPTPDTAMVFPSTIMAFPLDCPDLVAFFHRDGG